ncbi:MAG: sugar MFS transporter [Calditrichaeota bacterium]|nr:sugar MFS transporter [Calditrichota bacterium]
MNNSQQAISDSKNYGPPLAVLTTLFFMWGSITSLNDILIPHLKSLFELNYAQAMFIQFCFFAAYFIMSIPSGKLIERYGYRAGIIIGLIVTGIGCLLFLPASWLVSYPLFLLAFFTLASGITLLQVAANPYVAILGPPETASSRLNLSQALNSLGTTIAPLIGTWLILENTIGDAASRAESVQGPYIVLALVLFLLAVLINYAHLPAVEAETTRMADFLGEEEHASAWEYPHLVLGSVAIFLYVGAEVSIGSFLVNFLSEPTIGNFTEAQAGHYVPFYWGGAMIGRFVGSAILQKVRADRVLAFNCVATIILVLITILTSGPVAMWSIILVGLFNSIMFANIFTLAVDGLGQHTGQASGILCMAIVGGAVVPVLQGFLADAVGIHTSFMLAIFCYAYILFYALKGFRK